MFGWNCIDMLVDHHSADAIGDFLDGMVGLIDKIISPIPTWEMLGLLIVSLPFLFLIALVFGFFNGIRKIMRK